MSLLMEMMVAAVAVAVVVMMMLRTTNECLDRDGDGDGVDFVHQGGGIHGFDVHVELSTKVIDDTEKLRQTLCHGEKEEAR
eukprot:768374-Hanusia_phi.AAC.5